MSVTESDCWLTATTVPVSVARRGCPWTAAAAKAMHVSRMAVRVFIVATIAREALVRIAQAIQSIHSPGAPWSANVQESTDQCRRRCGGGGGRLVPVGSVRL